MSFLEYLEFICRCAHINFQGSEMETISLAEKLEFILDILIEKCLQLTRITEKEEELLSASDDDY